MARAISQSEKWREHRQAFLLALELGCTPKEAEAEIARIAAWEKHRALQDRLAARAAPVPQHSSPLRQAQGERDFGDANEPWMMRD